MEPVDREDVDVSFAESEPILSPEAKELQRNTFAERGRELLEQVLARGAGREKPVPLAWPALAEAMGGGLWPGVHFLVGTTGCGKSQLALEVSMHAARAGVPVLYLALELDDLGLFARALEYQCRMDPSTAGTEWERRVRWSDYYLGKVASPPPAEVLASLEALPFRWLVAPPHGWDYSTLEGATKALRELHGKAPSEPVLVVLDFLQLVASPPVGADRRPTREDLRERIGRAAYTARAVARDQNAAVLVLSSMARNAYKVARVAPERGEDGKYRKKNGEDNPPKRPAICDLVGLGKESGEVEYSADSVLVLCPENYQEGKRPPEGQRIHLAVAKLRAGKPGWVELAFDGTRFAEVKTRDLPVAEPDARTGEDDEGDGLWG